MNTGSLLFARFLMSREARPYTGFGPVWSLQFVAKPTITNAVVYSYTGGYVGPDIAPASSFHTITGNKNVSVSGSAYSYRVLFVDKTAYRWSDGTTDAITGTYYLNYPSPKGNGFSAERIYKKTKQKALLRYLRRRGLLLC